MARWPSVRHGNPEAYATRVTTSIFFSRRRRESVGRRVAGLLGRSAAVVADPADRVVGNDELRAALGQLPPRQRAIVVLRYLEDMSEADTAALLSCSVGTVKTQTHRGLARLRSLLEPDDVISGAHRGEGEVS